MPTITKVLTVSITVEQFLENCSDTELKELDLLIQAPRYANRINPDEKLIGFNQDKKREKMIIKINFLKEMVSAIYDNRKNQTRRNKGLERINDKPESFLYDGKDLMDRSIHWFEPLDKNGNPTEKYKFVKCPYGEVGDTLEVSEGLLLKIVNIRAERLKDISKEDAKGEGITKIFGMYKNYSNPNLGFVPDKIYDGYTAAAMSFFSLWQSIYGTQEKGFNENEFVWVINFEKETA